MKNKKNLDNENKKETKISFKKIYNGFKYSIMFVVLTLVFILSFHGIKVRVDKDYVPAVLGHTYLNVLSGSMSPEFEVNDLILGRSVNDFKELEVGDVITYKDGQMLVTHRITSINKENKTVVTKGDANNVEDRKEVSEGMIISKYTSKIPYGGHVVAKFQNFGFLGLMWLIFMFVIIKELIIEIKKVKSEKKLKQDQKELVNQN